MKITKIESFVLKHPLQEPFAFSQWWHKERQACIVKVETDEGLCGWGEANGPAEPIATMIKTVFAPLLIGEDPLLSHPLWQRLYTRARIFGQGGVSMGSLSAIDIALWDIKGRYFGVPISHLLGGQFRTQVRVYATGFFLRHDQIYPQSYVEEAQRYISEGFTAFKMKMGLFDFHQDLENIKAVHQVVSNKNLAIMVDANGAFDEPQATKAGKVLEKLDIQWFEEPLPKSNLRGYVNLRHKISVPLAAGETLVDGSQFHLWLREGALDIAQPDICKCGGFTEGQKIFALANFWGATIVPHVWGTTIARAATLQFIASIPDYPVSIIPSQMWFEWDASVNPLRDVVVKDRIQIRNGFAEVPRGAGLGIEIDEDYLKSYKTGEGELTKTG